MSRRETQMCPRAAENPGMWAFDSPHYWETNRWGHAIPRRLRYWWHNNGGPANYVRRYHKWAGRKLQTAPRFLRNALHLSRDLTSIYFGGYVWEWPWQPRICSYCGGAHPEDIIKLIKEGWGLDGTTKSYKRYVEPPRIGTRTFNGIDYPKLAFSPVPPVKLYTQHFDAEQIKRLNESVRKRSGA